MPVSANFLTKPVDRAGIPARSAGFAVSARAFTDSSRRSARIMLSSPESIAKLRSFDQTDSSEIYLPDWSDMTRFYVLLLSLLVSAGLVYFLGFMVLVLCAALALAALVFSTEAENPDERDDARVPGDTASVALGQA
jgi:hypothetical protein